MDRNGKEAVGEGVKLLRGSVRDHKHYIRFYMRNGGKSLKKRGWRWILTLQG